MKQDTQMSKNFFIVLFFSLLLSWSSAFGRDKDLNDSLPVYSNLAAASDNPVLVLQLVLRKEKYTSFPKEIWEFSNLEFLDLSKNKLDSIPKKINLLKNLRVLKLSKNDISSIPPELYELNNLEILVLSDNEMAYISPKVKKLVRLRKLDLWRTNVAVFPDEMSELAHLKIVDLRGVSLNRKQQDAASEVMPQAKVLFSPPCNCNL